MFLVHIFKDSFIFRRLLPLRHLALWKFVIYFFLMSFVGLFSFNLANLRMGGWKLGFVEYQLLLVDNINTPLPNDIYIRQLSGVNSTSGQSAAIELKDQKGTILYVFLTSEEELSIDKSVRQLIFTNKAIYYVKGDKRSLLIGNYNHFPEETSFEAINQLTGDEKVEALKAFSLSVEKSFGSQNAFYTIMTYSSVQIVLNMILVLLLTAVLQLFRFGYSKFMGYIEGLKIVISAMTIPSIMAFIVGFFTHALTPVIIQFGIGIVLMIVMLKFGKEEFH